MLKQLARFERTSKYIIVGFAILMALSLVMFFAPTRSANNAAPASGAEVVAKVGSDRITVQDLLQMREGIRQRFGGQISLAQLGGNKRFLQSLIVSHIIRQEAERLGLAASDAELADKLRKQFSDASGQFVGKERYKERVASFGGVARFENQLRDEIAQQKLKAFVAASVNISEEEVQQEYKRSESLFDVAYVVVSQDKLAEKIQPSEEDLRAYYDSHQTELRYNVPQRKVRYIYVDQEKSASKLQISDQELKAEYDRLEPKFKQAGVKVQQILLKVARKDLDPQVEEKAKELIKKLVDANGKTSEQAFAEAARGNSEDPATAKNGGFLPGVVKQNPNKPHGLYDRTLDMQPGDISDIPIRYAGNWYILRRGDTVTKTFEEAKNELLVSLRNRRSYTEALKVATKAQNRLKETKDPQKVAQELASSANMTAAEMVRETPYIKPGDDVKDIGTNQQFEDAVEKLNNPNDIGEPMGIKGGFAIPILVDKKEPRIPDFSEVRDQIADILKKQRAKEQFEQKAKDLAASINSADSLKAAGEKEGFDADEEPNFKLGQALGKAGSSTALDDQIFALKAGEITKTPIKVGDNWVIVGVTKRTDANMGEFAQKRDTLRQSMLQDRQSQVFEDYIGSIQQRMKQEGKIKIYNEVLAAIESDEEPAALPNFPQLNLPEK